MDEELPLFAQVFKRGNPSNTYVGHVDAADVATAMKRLREKITTVFHANDLRGTVRFWLSEKFHEDGFTI